MKKNESTLTVERMRIIMEDSFSYDHIRLSAVNGINRMELKGISERCRIIFNPERHKLISRTHDVGISKYFDIEEVGIELDYDIAEIYLKAFTSSLIKFCDTNSNYIQSLESRIC